MKKCFSLLTLLLFTWGVYGQALEKNYPLTRKSEKGFLYRITSENDIIKATYKLKGKKDEVSYEVYEFDRSLNLLNGGPKSVTVPVEDKPDKTVTSLSAWVGGSTSFDVLSMKLKFYKRERQFTWNTEKKRYDVKTLKSEEVKLKNDMGKKYMGYADYYNAEKQSVLVLTKIEKSFSLLNVSYDFDIKETLIPFDYPASLVYTRKLSVGAIDPDAGDDDLGSEDLALFIFAPAKKGTDANNYTVVTVNRDGAIISRNDFVAPSPNLCVMDAVQKGNDLYLIAGSSENKEAFYEQAYGEYTKISNAGGGQNLKEMSYFKKAKEFASFHIVKINSGKVAFASTASVKDFKSKLKTPPKQKTKVSSYDGGRFTVSSSYLADNGDIFITGQKREFEMIGTSNSANMYQDILCFQFDKEGQLKAQFGIDNLNDDKKSTVFEVGQAFYQSPSDKNVIYLQLLEVKGVVGYADFFDAMNGRKRLYAKHFPRILKINTATSEITTLTQLGSNKYFLKSGGLLASKSDLYFVGENLDDDEIWVASYHLD